MSNEVRERFNAIKADDFDPVYFSQESEMGGIVRQMETKTWKIFRDREAHISMNSQLYYCFLHLELSLFNSKFQAKRE